VDFWLFRVAGLRAPDSGDWSVECRDLRLVVIETPVARSAVCSDTNVTSEETLWAEAAFHHNNSRFNRSKAPLSSIGKSPQRTLLHDLGNQHVHQT
jgi:hypothetical protein